MKSKQTTKLHSRDVHVAIPQPVAIQTSTASKTVSLAIIITAIALVIFATLFALFNQSENLVKTKIDSLARDYYENYLYESFVTSDAYAKITDLDSVMQKYVDRGFARITLRQLILHDYNQHTNVAEYLREYCDENKTYVQIFPESPFDRTSYRIDTTYSCNF